MEAALLLPVVLLIVFGAIEFSTLYKDSATLSSAARSGGRMASAEPRIGKMPNDVATAVSTALSNMPQSSPLHLYVYDATSATTPPASCTNASSCVQYDWKSAGGGTFTFQLASSYDQNNPPNWIRNQQVCDTSSTWARVGVRITANHPFVTNLFGTNASKTLTADALFRVEPGTSESC